MGTKSRHLSLIYKKRYRYRYRTPKIANLQANQRVTSRHVATRCDFVDWLFSLRRHCTLTNINQGLYLARTKTSCMLYGKYWSLKSCLGMSTGAVCVHDLSVCFRLFVCVWRVCVCVAEIVSLSYAGRIGELGEMCLLAGVLTIQTVICKTNNRKCQCAQTVKTVVVHQPNLGENSKWLTVHSFM